MSLSSLDGYLFSTSGGSAGSLHHGFAVCDRWRTSLSNLHHCKGSDLGSRLVIGSKTTGAESDLPNSNSNPLAALSSAAAEGWSEASVMVDSCKSSSSRYVFIVQFSSLVIAVLEIPCRYRQLRSMPGIHRPRTRFGLGVSDSLVITQWIYWSRTESRNVGT